MNSNEENRTAPDARRMTGDGQEAIGSFLFCFFGLGLGFFFHFHFDFACSFPSAATDNTPLPFREPSLHQF